MSQAPPHISITCEVGQEHATFLTDHLHRAWRLIDEAPATLSLAVVSAATMAGLHEEFLGQPGPTDVLSFELEHEQGRVTEGEIILCLDVAAQEAARRGLELRQELLLYAIHGLLHLAGYDDQDDAGYARMHAREDEILQSLGFGPLFGADDAGESR